MKNVFKKIGSLIGCISLIFTIGACNGGKSDDKKEQGMDNLVKNFWESDVMYDETVMLVASTNENGEITSMPSGRLLFNADEIIEVKQYFHAEHSGVVTYKQGEDFDYADGVITAKGSVGEDIEGNKTVVNTTMPYITDRQWKGLDIFPGFASTSTSIPSTEGNHDIPYTESYHIVQLQISVTYRHSDEWSKATPQYQGEKLPHVIEKLKNKQDTEILVFGDSISTGSNSSSILNITPQLAPWYELMRANLENVYGGKVNLINKSMGGWTSTDGVSDSARDGWVGGKLVSQVGLPKLLSTELANYKPDLALVGFGMNDATLGVSLNNYASNIMKMIESLRQRNPECDIILIGTMLANPTAKNQSKNQTEYSALNLKIAEKYENVACVNVGTMHQNLLDSGKKYIDMTGNNVNHPNDFMARVYAMNMLSTLVEKK